MSPRVWFGMCLFALATAGATGCSDACGEAEDLCNECEGGLPDSEARCEAEFGNASADYCEAAISTYEANCPGQE